jgi:hypothetical protein
MWIDNVSNSLQKRGSSAILLPVKFDWGISVNPAQRLSGTIDHRLGELRQQDQISFY